MRALLLQFLGLLLTLALLPPLTVAALRWLPPPVSAFMLQSEKQPVDYRWVPAAKQSDLLRKAVVAAEDQKFYEHQGFDFDAIEKAMQHNETHRNKRGASTISQQVAKNLFLWNERSWLRKGLEVSFTVLIEALWDKPRILETYLNIAEFGPGIYGVEAAAQRFFGASAARLTPEQAARLAAVLPNPRKYKAASPGAYVQRRTQWILGQMGYRPPQSEPDELPADDTDEPLAPGALRPPELREGPRRSFLTPPVQK